MITCDCRVAPFFVMRAAARLPFFRVRNIAFLFEGNAMHEDLVGAAAHKSSSHENTVRAFSYYFHGHRDRGTPMKADI